MILLHGISAGSSAMMKLLLALFLAGCAGVGEELPETVAMEDPTVVAEWIWTDGQMAWGAEASSCWLWPNAKIGRYLFT